MSIGYHAYQALDRVVCQLFQFSVCEYLEERRREVSALERIAHALEQKGKVRVTMCVDCAYSGFKDNGVDGWCRIHPPDPCEGFPAITSSTKCGDGALREGE
jgi:hypothetical protein